MKKRSLARIAAVAMLPLPTAGGPAWAGAQDDVLALFRKFIAAQNAHDLNAVAEILQDSPQFLWVTRGTAVWGRDAALKQFEASYKGTWLLEPKFDEVKVSELSSGVVRVMAPSIFTIAPPGKTAEPRRFLLTQFYVMTPAGWKLSTIVPYAVP